MEGPYAAPEQGSPFAPPPPAPPPLGVPPVQGGPAISVGRVFGRAFSVWIANFVPFTVVTVIVHLPVFLVAGLVPAALTPGTAWYGLTQLLSYLAYLLVTGALTSGVLGSLQGQPARVGALLDRGVGRIGVVFASSFRMGLWLVLGFILLIVPGVIWYCALFVAVPAAVVEPALGSSAAALARSRTLTAGSRWQIFGVVVLVGLVMLVGMFVAGFLAVLATGLPLSTRGLIGMVVMTLITPLGACAPAVAYHDLRVAKEGVSTADLARVFE
jgi:hypothetical protein